MFLAVCAIFQSLECFSQIELPLFALAKMLRSPTFSFALWLYIYFSFATRSYGISLWLSIESVYVNIFFLFIDFLLNCFHSDIHTYKISPCPIFLCVLFYWKSIPMNFNCSSSVPWINFSLKGFGIGSVVWACYLSVHNFVLFLLYLLCFRQHFLS